MISTDAYSALTLTVPLLISIGKADPFELKTLLNVRPVSRICEFLILLFYVSRNPSFISYFQIIIKHSSGKWSFIISKLHAIKYKDAQRQKSMTIQSLFLDRNLRQNRIFRHIIFWRVLICGDKWDYKYYKYYYKYLISWNWAFWVLKA